MGPTLSFRGIDNASYYWLLPDRPRYYDDVTGTGNSLNLSHPRVLQMVMDSIRHWVLAGHVDGFRFDLSTTLGRQANGFSPTSAFFAALRQDPVLADVKFIAEPWDLGSGGYQTGHFPPYWSEWNDYYRRTMRRFWAGEGSLIGEVSARMTGSSDLFNHDGRRPRASINHITVHDGFTLADLVSYAHKHNEANGEDNRDGSDDNYSTNCGVEGPSTDPKVVALRNQLRRNQLACLMLAHGVPILLAGDEVGNSQSGNNNAYCQDNPIGWIDWSGLGREGDDLMAFIGRLTQIRRRYPQLRPRKWVDGKRPDGSFGVLWLTPAATEMSEADWNFPKGRFIAYLLSPPGRGPMVYVALNGSPRPIEIVLPAAPNVFAWSEILNTADTASARDGLRAHAKLSVAARSVLVLASA
jgi:glycogen operon protein